MNRLLSLCFYLLSYISIGSAHDIHVSVSDILIKENTIEITIKTFIDDLQIAIGLEPGSEVPEGYSSADSLISQYIKENILLNIHGKEMSLHPLVIDASNDAVWITVIIQNVHTESIKSLTWDSTFLLDVYDDQTNIVNIKRHGKREVFSLTSKKTSLSHSF